MQKRASFQEGASLQELLTLSCREEQFQKEHEGYLRRDSFRRNVKSILKGTASKEQLQNAQPRKEREEHP